FGTDGELSLALGALPHVGCVIAVDPQLAGGVNRTTEVYEYGMQVLSYSASEQELHRDVPAVFGSAQSDSLVDATSWAPALPSHVMLAYDMGHRAGRPGRQFLQLPRRCEARRQTSLLLRQGEDRPNARSG